MKKGPRAVFVPQETSRGGGGGGIAEVPERDGGQAKKKHR